MGKVDLSGKFGFLGLGEVLQLIGSNGGTGVLRITSKFVPEPGHVWFQKGNIIDAATNSQTGIDAMYSLFGWTEGEFEFTRGEVSVKQTIHTNRMEIILDGLRMVDDGATPKLGAVSVEAAHSDATEKSREVPVIMGTLIDYMYVAAEEEFHAGQKIINENSHGSWVWTILEGVVDVVKSTPNGQLTILKLGAGAFVGSIGSFSFQDNIRSAAVIASTDVQLGVLDSQRLSEEFSHNSREFRDFILSLEKRRDEVTEKTVEIYQKTNLFKKLTRNKKPAIKQGKNEKNLYQITRGEASVIRREKTGFVPLAALKKGDFIGRIPFMDIGHEPHLATVFATKNFEVKKLNPDDLQAEYDDLSSTFRNMIDVIATSISITTRLACEFQKMNAPVKK